MNRFTENFDIMSESEKKVCQYIIKNMDKVVDMSVYSVADAAFTSKTVVINTAKKIGFTGFTDLKYYIKQHIGDTKKTKTVVKSMQDFNTELIETTKMTCNFVGERELDTTASKILESKTVYIAARGTSKSIASHLNHMLITIGIKCVLIDDYNLLTLIADRIDKNELMILLSLSGETAKIVDAARRVKARESSLIAITSFTHNSLSRMADISIYSLAQDTDTIDNDSISRLGMFINVEMIINRVKELNTKSRQ